MSSAKKLIIAVALCVFALMPLAVAQQAKGVFTENQANYVGCAKEKLYAVYTFLDPTKRFDDKAFKPAVCGKGREVAPITPPKWLEGTLPAMQSHMVWELPGSAAGRPEYLSEAEMWRRAIWRVWDFLTLAENINTGTTYTQQETMELFGNIRTNYLLELDRLNTNPVVIKYNMRDSMDGRGRTIMATLELINSEMDSVAESFVASPSVWREKFRKSVIGISVLSQNIYKDFMSQTPPMMPETYKRARDNSLLIMLLTMIGMFSIFFSVYKIMSDKDEEINAAIARYMQRSTAWTEDYSRQFLDINVKTIVLGTLAVFSLIGLLFGFAAGGAFGFVMFAICFCMGAYGGLKMPGILLKILKKKRGDRINAQLMDALILLSNSLKSGMDIVQGFDMVSRDLRPPISDEFSLVIKNYQLGTPFERALEGMEERVESRLLSYMVKAIVLQRQVGGNLTKIFERIVENIREESKLEEKLQAMTAQTRIQAIVVGVMPWVMVSVMFIFQPDTMISFYTSPFGIGVFFFCVIWIGIGINLVNKLGEIKV